MPAPSDPIRLTLRLDRATVEAAKRYARARGASLSQLLADYVRSLREPEAPPPEEDAWKADLPPITRQFVSRTPKRNITEEDYYRYLEEKHR